MHHQAKRTNDEKPQNQLHYELLPLNVETADYM